jgi:hypothetical protein
MQGDSWSIGVAINLKNNQFKLGQTKTARISQAVKECQAIIYEDIYPDMVQYLQYGDSVLLGPSSVDDYKGETEHLLVSGLLEEGLSAGTSLIPFLQKRQNSYFPGDLITFYGTGLAGGWIIGDKDFVLSQGIKNGIVSQQLKYVDTFSYGTSNSKYYLDATLPATSFRFGIDLIRDDFEFMEYIITPISDNNHILIATQSTDGVTAGVSGILLGDYHRGGWRKENAQRLRLNIQTDSESQLILRQNLLQYNQSTDYFLESLLIPYQYYRMGGKVYLDNSRSTLTYTNWKLEMILRNNQDYRFTSEMIVIDILDGANLNEWIDFQGIGLLKSGISNSSTPSLDIWFENDGIAAKEGGGDYDYTMLYIDELWLEHGGGVNYANVDGCLDFGRYNVWPEQQSIEMNEIEVNSTNLYMPIKKHIIKARFNFVSQEFWDQLELILEWQKKGHCLNLHTNLNDYPYVMTGKIYIREFKKDSWDLTMRSFILEFIEE